ncbi:MAG: hypothetical protein WAW11_00065 [Patescibacteria group bacterium]
MRKLWIAFVFVAMCGLTTAFGQLRVTNNFGQDLKVAINGEENKIANKETKTFAVRGQKTVYLDCVTLDGKNKFTLPKEVSRSGLVVIDPTENRLDRGENTANNVPAASTPNNIMPGTGATTVAPATSGSLAAILQGGKPANTNTGNNGSNSVPVSSITTMSNQTNIVQQPQAGLEPIKIVYTGAERFKVFSDLGGSQLQGTEFRGKATADSIQDNAKNEYDVYIQKNKDIHIGVIFNPEDAINIYGEFRKRVNQGDATLYVNEGDIKKMSTNEKKEIKLKFMAKDYKLLFDPKDESKDGKSTLISMGYDQTSRKFKAPIGQFYLKASCTNTLTGMFYPTVYIPIHVISSDNVITITAEQIKVLTGSDINLKWSNLR